MKTITVPYLPKLADGEDEGVIALTLRTQGASDTINCVNWPEVTDHCPETKFYIGHDGHAIYLLYDVSGPGLRAINNTNQSPVSQDSCVEFFIVPDTEIGRYWNFEFNAIGAVNASHRVVRPAPTRLDDMTISAIRRYSSAGTEPFEEKDGIFNWSLLVVIPLSIIGVIFDGKTRIMRANFLKCGSKTRNPHFVSWSPIETPAPDFHKPEFFGELILGASK